MDFALWYSFAALPGRKSKVPPPLPSIQSLCMDGVGVTVTVAYSLPTVTQSYQGTEVTAVLHKWQGVLFALDTDPRKTVAGVDLRCKQHRTGRMAQMQGEKSQTLVASGPRCGSR